MPRTSSGSYQQPAGTSAVTGQPISSSSENNLIGDIGTEITNSLDRLGRAAMLAALPMGGFRLTGVATPTASTDGATKAYVDALVIPSGTIMLFAQAAAPTGWTQVTTYNDAVPRLVSGAGATFHGTIGLSTFISGGTLGHVLTTTEMPSHTHTVNDPTHTHGYQTYAYSGTGAGGGPGDDAGQHPQTDAAFTGISINYTGGNASHNHGLQDLQYLDIITCSKN